MNKSLGSVLKALVLIGVALLTVWDYNNTQYKCPICETQYHPSVGKYVLGPHFPTRRYLKCPTCGNRSWHKRVVMGMGPD